MIAVKSSWEIDRLRKAGQINACAHSQVSKWLVPGTTTEQLDQALEAYIVDRGGKSSFRELGTFPGATCISVNECIGHGVPGHRRLAEGDVVKVDIGVEYEGYHSDAAATYIVGQGNPAVHRLVNTAHESLWAGIHAATVGHRLSDISYALYQRVVANGFTVIRNAFGHGIGLNLHEDPQIAPFGPPGCGPRIRAGMVLAIEPIVVAGLPYTTTLDDGWTTRTVDGALGAHFEHTILITETGPEVLTASEPNAFPQLRFGMTESTSHTVVHHGFPFTMRPKTSADDESIVRLAEEQMNDILVEAWGRPVNPKEILGLSGATTLVVVDPEGALAGFFTCSHQRVCHLNTLVLAAKYQGMGLGKVVMQLMEGMAARSGYLATELCVQTNNLRAVAFYEKLGYKAYAKPYINTVAMRKQLTTTAKDPCLSRLETM